ncbi:MAG: ornithine carbamoyltransferase, partial [Eggerthellaceae bacterium]|nr:ornithine carbamoyltransferase [Eggerthellaceae bacterium]
VRNNMAYAWMYACAILSMNFVAYGPEELIAGIDHNVMTKVKKLAESSGAEIHASSNEKCLEGADVLYTDIWASMGEEAQITERVKLLSPYKIKKDTLAKTKNPEVLFMHCLPSFHDFETKMAKQQQELGFDIREVSDEVFNSENAVVFDEAENRMHIIKAVLVATLA